MVWLKESLSYTKPNLNPKRDITFIFVLLIMIVWPFSRVDLTTPTHYQEHKIFKAIYEKDQEALEKFLSDKSALNFKNRFGFTPLMAAANEGNLEFLTKLEAAGAIYQGELVTDKSDKLDGMNIVYLGLSNNDPKLADYLLTKYKNNFDINAELSPKFGSLVHFMAYKCNAEILDMLIKYGANMNLKNKSSLTPMHISAKEKCFSTMIILKEAGANLSEKDNSGKTPLDYANGNMAYYLKKNL